MRYSSYQIGFIGIRLLDTCPKLLRFSHNRKEEADLCFYQLNFNWIHTCIEIRVILLVWSATNTWDDWLIDFKGMKTREGLFYA